MSPGLRRDGTVARVLSGLFALAVGVASADIRFDDVSTPAGITGMGESYGTTFTDIDGDGYVDIFANNHQYTDSYLYHNRPGGTAETGGRIFHEVAASQLTGAFQVLTDSHGLMAADWDNDGDTDIMEVTGAGWHFPLWENLGAGTFVNRAAELGFYYPPDWLVSTSRDGMPTGGRSPLFLDYTGDGRLDVLVTTRDNYPAYRTPTGTFRQDLQLNGDPLFVLDESTGVDMANDVPCHYALLAELTGDGVQDVICADSSRVERVWDVTQLPWREVRSVIGDALYNAYPADFAVGDFNGDLRTDLFAPLSAAGTNMVHLVSSQVINGYFAETFTGGSFAFNAIGPVSFEFDWWTEIGDIFYGAARLSPPPSVYLQTYDGQAVGAAPRHILFELTCAEAAGNPSLGATGVYIGCDNGRWTVQIPGVRDWNTGLVLRSTAFSNLAVTGAVQRGQPTGGGQYLFLQDASHRLVNSSSNVPAVNRSCKSAAAGDLDNDGDLDIYVGCVSVLSNLENWIAENQGDGTFTLVPDAGGAIGQMPEGRLDTVSLGDFDNDGRLDLLLANGHLFRPMSYAGRYQLFRNVSDNANHWVQLKLQGTISNRDGIGAIVYATTPDGRVQMREQGGGQHKKSQDFSRIHFGLAGATQVDIEVRWPSGTVDRFDGLAADAIHTLVEGGSVGYRLSVSDLSVDEGAGDAVFDVTLSPAPGAGESVTVAYRTADGSALAGSDYVETVGNLVFGPGETQKSVAVPVLDDMLAEAAETFELSVSSVQAAGVTATATIVDDDGGGTTPACGAPVYDKASETAAFLWNDCGTDDWHLRVTAGGQTVTYEGGVSSDQAFTSLAGFRLSADDVLTPSPFTTPTDGPITFLMNVGGTGHDGIDFSVAAGAGGCFTLTAPDGVPVYAGANRVAVGVSVDLSDYGACGGEPPPVPVCGAPDYDKAIETAAFLWNDCGTDDWHLRVTAGGQGVSYTGTLTSTPALASLAPFSYEANDVLPPAFVMNVGSTGQDGLDFTLVPGADVCLTLDGPAGMTLLAGATRIDVGDSVSLPDFGPCGSQPPPLPACGAPVYDKASETAAFLWNDCGTDDWHLRVTAGGQTVTYEGGVSSDQAFTSLAGFRLSADDVLTPSPFTTPTDGPITFLMNVGGTGHDGMDFSVTAGADGCFALTAPPGVPVYAGADRVPVGDTVSLTDFGGCTAF